MIRVVLDTNVLISGTFWSGASSRIIRLVEEGKITLILSPPILKEYIAVLHYPEIKQKIHHHHERAQAALKLAALGEIVEPSSSLHVIKEDPDDDKFLEAALAGNVDYIVSQDKHLLTLKEFEGIQIITPEEFLTAIFI